MLVTSIFFFSYNIFKKLFPSVRKKSSFCGKGLRLLKTLIVCLCRVHTVQISKILGFWGFFSVHKSNFTLNALITTVVPFLKSLNQNQTVQTISQSLIYDLRVESNLRSASKNLLFTNFSASQNQFCTSNILTHCHSVPCFNGSEMGILWIYCGKRRNCSLWAISPFP